MDDNLKKAILNLSKSSDWQLVREYLLESIEGLLLEPSKVDATAEDFKINRIAIEKAYDLLSNLIGNLEFKDVRVSNNSKFR